MRNWRGQPGEILEENDCQDQRQEQVEGGRCCRWGRVNEEERVVEQLV